MPPKPKPAGTRYRHRFITVPPEVDDVIEAEWRGEGISRSEWFVKAAVAFLAMRGSLEEV